MHTGLSVGVTALYEAMCCSMMSHCRPWWVGIRKGPVNGLGGITRLKNIFGSKYN